MMVSDSEWGIQIMDIVNELGTFLIFIFTCIFMMCMLISYFVVNLVRDTWVNFLEKRFPNLEFVRQTSVRSAVDTHRNMGIITLLVTVKGRCDPGMIKRRIIEDILEKRQNDGRYTYRHLRMTLTTRWGRYAWQEMIPFNIDNHLVITNGTYRGRPVSHFNIQECVSETVSKYLVPDLPPWQITIIPDSSCEKYYMLIRIHHMLLSYQGLDLGDLLLLSHSKNENATNKYNAMSDTYKINRRSHPFQDLYRPPKSIPILYDILSETFSNNWNEFLSVYDPLENPSILKNPTLKTTFAIFMITVISVLKQAIQFRTISKAMISHEFRQKQLTTKMIYQSIWNTLNPVSMCLNLVMVSFSITILILIKLPLLIACEFRSMCMIYDEKYSDTSYIKTIISGWAILKDAIKEALYYWRLCYNGPRIILEELLSADNNSRHQLQSVSLCGRKVISWSDPVPLEKINEIQDVTGASSSEILISATSASMRDYLIQYSLDIPDSVLITARYFPQEHIMQKSHRKIISTAGGGILCLNLPIRNPFGLEYDPVTELRAVQQVILRARLRQPALYLATLWQLDNGAMAQVLPSPIIRLILNVLSRKFPVTLSEVAPAVPTECKKLYLWGQEVEDLMYWRPPQANVCMSLTLMTFGEYVRLGVMTDALLSPEHTIITSTFAQHVSNLAAAAGVSMNFRNFNFLTDDSDTPGSSQTSQNSTLSSSSLDLDFDSRNYSDEDNNGNLDESIGKHPTSKKLHFNIPKKCNKFGATMTSF